MFSNSRRGLSKKGTMITCILLLLLLITIGCFLNKFNQPATNELINLVVEDKVDELSLEQLNQYKDEIRADIKKLPNKEQLKNDYYALGMVEYLQHNYNSAIYNLELSLQHISENDTELKMRINSVLSNCYILENKLNQSVKYFNNAKEIALQNHMEDKISNLYYEKAHAMNMAKQNLTDAINVLLQSLDYPCTDEEKIRNYLFLAQLNKISGKFSESLTYNAQAVKLAIEIKSAHYISESVISLGENYYIKQNYMKTIIVYENLLKSEKIEDTSNLLMVYGYLLDSYSREGSYEEYEKYKNLYEEKIKTLDSLSQSRELAWLYAVCSKIELNFNNIEQAKSYLQLAQKLYNDKPNEMYYSVDLYLKYSNIELDYYEDNDYEKALKSLEDLLAESKERGFDADIKYDLIDGIIKNAYKAQDYDTMIPLMIEQYNDQQDELYQIGTDNTLNEISTLQQAAQVAQAKFKVAILTLLVAGMIYGIITTRRKSKEIIKLNEQLQEVNKVDALTQVYNRGYLNETLNEHLKQKQTNSFVMIDIDYFKKYNDHYGHMNGDRVLAEVAQTIKEVFKNDKVFRYGGEEFTVLSTRPLQEIIIDLEKLQNVLYEKNIKHKYSETSDRVTLSIGLSTKHILTQEDLTELIKDADEKLYQSKQSGRNKYTY